MKRNQLIKHLRQHGCVLLREGANHAIYQNPANGQQSAVGRHRELSDLLCKKVCQQLSIPPAK
ncbi:type II toxin-antitoxin system HicA family toxin [Catalinimonas niigatensis]|uniref:type II toxin-antitoxin system HicA family toxin n=1 Tax=Catalinimonas niigatensis TaxID=1397264 RepID=UPI0038993699